MTADPTRTLPPEYYVRQLHDMKYGIDIGGLRPPGMRLYAEVCAWALARAHARSGNPAEIAGYLGQGDVFDEAIASFAVAYADQTERTTPLSSPRSVRAGWPARPASERASGGVGRGALAGVVLAALTAGSSHLPVCRLVCARLRGH